MAKDPETARKEGIMTDVSQFDPSLEVDPQQGFKATKFNVLSCAHPHMISWHFSW